MLGVHNLNCSILSTNSSVSIPQKQFTLKQEEEEEDNEEEEDEDEDYDDYNDIIKNEEDIENYHDELEQLEEQEEEDDLNSVKSSSSFTYQNGSTPTIAAVAEYNKYLASKFKNSVLKQHE